nr:phosphopantothenoylcysteine decarboxylase [Anaerolineae bacterium]
ARAMLAAVLDATDQADALIMSAAVADFRPVNVAEQKIKKKGETEGMVLELTRNPDILAEVALRKRDTGFPRVTVGFAAETQDVLANAQTKLERKRLDFIVANDVTAADAGFAVETNRVTILATDGSQTALPLLTKREVAEEILDRMAKLLAGDQ